MGEGRGGGGYCVIFNFQYLKRLSFVSFLNLFLNGNAFHIFSAPLLKMPNLLIKDFFALTPDADSNPGYRFFSLRLKPDSSLTCTRSQFRHLDFFSLRCIEKKVSFSCLSSDVLHHPSLQSKRLAFQNGSPCSYDGLHLPRS